MSKDLAFEMQAKNIEQLYPSTFTKKDAILQAQIIVDDILENGEVQLLSVFANITKLKTVIDNVEINLRQKLPREKSSIFGVSFNPVEGGNTVNYVECEIYQTLKADLDARVELLKLAQKQPVFDAYGNQVPKVSTTPRKSSITVKF